MLPQQTRENREKISAQSLYKSEKREVKDVEEHCPRILRHGKFFHQKIERRNK